MSEIKDLVKIRKSIPDYILEVCIEVSSIYSKKYWLLFIEERLRRTEYEIAII